jgi:hypothetical protein
VALGVRVADVANDVLHRGVGLGGSGGLNRGLILRSSRNLIFELSLGLSSNLNAQSADQNDQQQNSG